MLGRAAGRTGLDQLADAAVQRTATLVEQALVGDVLHQRVLERILRIREQTRLVEQLARSETPEGLRKALLVEIGDALEQRQRDLVANHRGALQEVLLVRSQPIDARGQERLHCRGPCTGPTSRASS